MPVDNLPFNVQAALMSIEDGGCCNQSGVDDRMYKAIVKIGLKAAKSLDAASEDYRKEVDRQVSNRYERDPEYLKALSRNKFEASMREDVIRSILEEAGFLA